MPSSKHRGAAGELAACAWLLERGFEVFRNVSSAGPADLVAWHVESGSVYLIDVKARNALYALRGGLGFSFGLRFQRARPEVHFLFVAGKEVVGFMRKSSNGKGGEIYTLPE